MPEKPKPKPAKTADKDTPGKIEEPAVPDETEMLDGLDVPIEYVEAEDDETGTEHGDVVQLVRTGWVRFFIGGHGRVRFRPARFGELRRILTAHEEMVDLIQEEAHRIKVVSDGLQARADEVNTGDLSSEDRHAEIVKIQAEDRHLTREFRRFQEDHHIAWWQMVHGGDGEWGGLGVGGEELPALDDLPVWITQAPLVALAVAHWKAVPLDRGRR
jgi:hypothetical protein